MEECASIYLRSYDGWWLRINNDGSGSYGFGTGLARVEVKESTFGFEQLSEDIENAFLNKPKNAEEPYMAVSCWTANTSSAVEHHLAQDRNLLASLFHTARTNVELSENEFDRRSYDQVESFWRGSPWRESIDDSPDLPGPDDGN